VLRTLAKAIEAVTHAVTYRYPEISEVQDREAWDFAGRRLDKKCNYGGIARQACNKFDNLCAIEGPANWYVLSRPEVTKRDEFTWSQLVFSGFKYAGIPLTHTEPNWSEPGGIAWLASKKALEYIGHLKA
jgi:hypothetical protein